MLSMALRITTRDRVRHLQLDRADKLNALDRHLYGALNAALDDATDDPEISVVVLTGSGRAFSAGVDLAELARSAQPGGDPGFTEPAIGFIERLARFPKPLVVAVNGIAVGIGATMLGYADVIIAGDSARFRYPFTALGISPELGSSWMLPQQVGWQAAQWLLLSASWIDAERARDMGLVLEVVPDDELAARAAALADELAERKLASLMATKATYTAWRHGHRDTAMEVESGYFGPLLRGE